jgi:hypothetical protein
MIVWGDVPTWVAALGTVGAFWFTGLTVRRDHVARTAAEARHVAAWAETIPGQPDPSDDEIGAIADPELIRNRIRQIERVIVTRNGSDEPVYDVDVYWTSKLTSRVKISIPVLAPGQVERRTVATGGDAIVVFIGFRDSAGRIWHRDEIGHLSMKRTRVRVYNTSRPKYPS